MCHRGSLLRVILVTLITSSGLLNLRYRSNVDTVASVSLSGSNSPSRASSKILTAISSTTGVEPVSFSRAQACLNARFIASRRSPSLNVASPVRLALGGYYRRPDCCGCELFHTRVRRTQKTDLKTGLTPPATHFNPYRAFVIGTDGLAIAMHSIVAGYDDEALEKATRLQGALRINCVRWRMFHQPPDSSWRSVVSAVMAGAGQP
jgi:hypothetical protein